ncbi:MAG: hypothetical protein ACAH95_04355 [Fimbriimonas sp.]
MPKIFGRTVSPVMIVLMAGAATYLVFGALFPAEEPVKPKVTKKTSKVSTKVQAYTDDDFKLKFATYAEPVKNTFKPLVVRQDSTRSSSPGSLPLPFVGKGDWVYSGRVVVNGVPQGLLEDRESGDSEFVFRGQRWKYSTILEIGADSIELQGPEGATITLIAGASEPAPTESVTAPGAAAPVTVGPGLMGNIGVQPLPEATQNERPRRRNRRNRDTQGMEE